MRVTNYSGDQGRCLKSEGFKTHFDLFLFFFFWEGRGGVVLKYFGASFWMNQQTIFNSVLGLEKRYLNAKLAASRGLSSSKSHLSFSKSRYAMRPCILKHDSDISVVGRRLGTKTFFSEDCGKICNRENGRRDK